MRGPWVGSALAAAALAGCSEGRDTHVYAYVSPDRSPVVEVEPEGAAEPVPGLRNTVYFRASRGAGQLAPLGKANRVTLGSFTGEWNPAAFAWLDETTVSACPLKGDKDVEIAIPVSTPTSHRTYHIITAGCPAFLLPSSMSDPGIAARAEPG
jgi:hypothetical protein